MPPEWQVTSDIFCRYLMIISSSINIVIYCWGGKQFKTVLMSIICGREIPIVSIERKSAISSLIYPKAFSCKVPLLIS